MKSWHYVGIFVVIVGIIGGVIFYNAVSIRKISDDTVEMTHSTSTQKEVTNDAVQAPIDVMNDIDIESDAFDTTEEDLSELEDVEGLIEDMTVEF